MGKLQYYNLTCIIMLFLIHMHQSGRTAVHVAAWTGQNDMITYLINQGAGVDDLNVMVISLCVYQCGYI